MEVEEQVETQENTPAEVEESTEGKVESTEKTFTQAQVNKVVGQRVKKVKAENDSLQEQLTELQNQIAEMQTRLGQQSDDTKQASLRVAVQQASSKFNVSADLAQQLIQIDKIQWDGIQPININDLVKTLVETHPELIKRAVKPQTPEPIQNATVEVGPMKQGFWQGGGVIFNSKDN